MEPIKITHKIRLGIGTNLVLAGIGTGLILNACMRFGMLKEARTAKKEMNESRQTLDRFLGFMKMKKEAENETENE